MSKIFSLAVCLGLALFLTFKGFSDKAKDDAFDSRGEMVLLEPVKQFDVIKHTTKKDHHTTRSSTSYQATMGFNTKTGQHITVKRKMPKQIYNDLNNGKDVYIQYLPEDPQTTRFKGYPLQTKFEWFFIVLLFGAAGAMFLWKKP